MDTVSPHSVRGPSRKPEEFLRAPAASEPPAPSDQRGNRLMLRSAEPRHPVSSGHLMRPPHAATSCGRFMGQREAVAPGIAFERPMGCACGVQRLHREIRRQPALERVSNPSARRVPIGASRSGSAAESLQARPRSRRSSSRRSTLRHPCARRSTAASGGVACQGTCRCGRTRFRAAFVSASPPTCARHRSASLRRSYSLKYGSWPQPMNQLAARLAAGRRPGCSRAAWRMVEFLDQRVGLRLRVHVDDHAPRVRLGVGFAERGAAVVEDADVAVRQRHRVVLERRSSCPAPS